MANITPTTAAVFIEEVWARDVKLALERNLVLANLVDRYDGDVKNGGDVVHVLSLANLGAADTKAAGSNITYTANTETEKTITINQHKYKAILLEDIVKVQARTDLRDKYTEKMAYSLKLAIDGSIAALHSGLSQNVSGGAALDDADIIAAHEYLDIADVPRDNRNMVIHSEALADLRAVNKFTTYDNTGQVGVAVDKRKNGLIANVYGADILVSNNVEETAGTPNLLHNILFHKEAFGLALQQEPKLVAEYSVDALGWKIAMHTIYGVAEIRDEFAVDIELNS